MLLDLGKKEPHGKVPLSDLFHAVPISIGINQPDA